MTGQKETELMGVDAQIYAEGDITDEQVEAANLYLAERCGAMRWAYREDPNEPLLHWTDYPERRLEVFTGSRYYGPGYERGDWPVIYACIVALRAALPHCKVFYSGDTVDYGMEATDEYLAEIWAHWLGPDGLAYRNR